MHVPHHVAHREHISDIVDEDNHVLQDEEPEVRPTDTCGRRTWGGKQRILMRYWAEQKSKGGCGIVSNSPNGRRAQSWVNCKKSALWYVLRYY